MCWSIAMVILEAVILGASHMVSLLLNELGLIK